MKVFHRNLFAGVATALIFGSAFAATPVKAEQKFLTLSAGGNTGSWYVGSTIISEIVNKNIAETTMTPQPGGGVANMKKLQAEKVEFGYMMTSTMAEALKGVGTFEKPHDKLRTVMALAPMYNQLVVRTDSGISSFEDLAGKRVSPGKKGFATAANFDKTMAAMESSVKALEDSGGSVSYLDYADAGQNMRDGLLDAVFVTGVIPFGLYNELSATLDIKFVPMSDKLMSSYVAKNQGWSKGGIPAGSYDNDAEIPTVVTFMGLASHTAVPDDIVYNVTKAVFEQKQKLADGYPAYRGLGPKVFINDSLNGLPMHPGAEKFWKEKGLM